MDEIIIKFLQNQCSDEEKRALFSWIDETPGNMEYYKHMRQLWDINNTLVNPDENPEILDKAYASLKQKISLNDKNPGNNKIKPLLSAFLRYAAVAVICFGLSWIFWIYKTNKAEVAWQTIEVPVGQRVKVTLVDGTQVWLNSKTKFTYPQTFAQNNRMVKLEGEGYFEVTHNENLPFIVNTNKVNVRVKGTKFNVYAYENDPAVETTLVEGKVEFIENAPHGIRLDMKPNQQFIYNSNSKKVQIANNVDTHEITSWTEGLHFFNHSSLRDIILRLERYYNTQITVMDSSILDYSCIGKFRVDESLNDVLKVISTGKPFKYTINKNKVVIY